MSTFRCLLAALSMSPALFAAPLFFDFDSGPQGWTGTHVATGGNLAGYLTRRDTIDVPAGSFFSSVAPTVSFNSAALGTLDYGAEVSFDWRYDIEVSGNILLAPGALILNLVGPSGYLNVQLFHEGAQNMWFTPRFTLTETNTTFWPFGPGVVGPIPETQFRAFLPTITNMSLISNFPYQQGPEPATVTASIEIDNFRIADVPEPGSWGLMLSAAVALIGFQARHSRKVH